MQKTIQRKDAVLGKTMKILIDADGCPVVDITVRAAKEHKLECLILCDTSHIFNNSYAKTVMVSKGADSVDFKIVNLLSPNDIVVTQDYGLAAMCLARNAQVIRQDGLVYTQFNIDALLASRYECKKIRNAGGRIKGNSKRRPEEDERFKIELNKLIEKSQNI